ncbi:unnamed protein product [marine sediment metagenome]|uniref:Uncharacterized protein n=1 Tax=marine sediment metagenome TaxID=412755 RepID=X0XC73_9ZZZZ
MTKVEYEVYVKRVNAFFRTEGIANLSSSKPDEHCPCGEDYTGQKDYEVESYFSHARCECCLRPLGGGREHATGWCPGDEGKPGEVLCYEVCRDCLYYAEYGRLDDMTMLEIEDS